MTNPNKFKSEHVRGILLDVFLSDGLHANECEEKCYFRKDFDCDEIDCISSDREDEVDVYFMHPTEPEACFGELTGRSILANILETHEDVTFTQMDGLESAIIGVNSEGTKLIYSEKKILENIRRTFEGDSNMTEEDVRPHFECNISRAIPHMGPNAPIICMDDF